MYEHILVIFFDIWKFFSITLNLAVAAIEKTQNDNFIKNSYTYVNQILFKGLKQNVFVTIFQKLLFHELWVKISFSVAIFINKCRFNWTFKNCTFLNISLIVLCCANLKMTADLIFFKLLDTIFIISID